MESNLGWLVHRTALLWRTVVDGHMAELGLIQSRWVAMLALDTIGKGCSQSSQNLAVP